MKVNLLSVFVVKHDDAFVFSFLGSWLEFRLFGHIVVFFCIFHVVHVSLPCAKATSGFCFREHVV